MKEILQKKNKKRVVKYALRKYSVGVVSVAISASLISPVSAAVVQGSDLNTIISQEAYDISKNTEDTLVKDKDEEVQEDKQERTETSEEIKEEIIEEINKESVESKAEVTEEKVENISEKNIQPQILEDQVEYLANELKKVTYEELFNTLTPVYDSVDRLEIMTEMIKETGSVPSDDVINQKLKVMYMDKLDLKRSFESVQNNLEDTLRKVFADSSYGDASRVLNNKYKILLGLSYLERQYSFEFNGISAKDLILYHSDFNVSSGCSLDNLIALGNLSFSELEIKNNISTFNNRISFLVGKSDLLSFIESAVKLYEPNITPSEWFKKQSKAYIIEAESKYSDTSLYNKMKKDSRLKSHLIPLLNLSTDNIYAISTMSTVNYGLVDTYVDRNNIDTLNEFKLNLKDTAKKQEAFLNFWYRISKTKDKLFEGNNIIIVDTMQKYDPTGYERAEKLWSPKTGDNAISGVREFITPLGFYSKYLFVDGQAAGDLVNVFLAKSLTDRGQSVYTHELTHILEKKVWFNGFGRRAGKGGEAFTRGMFESIDNTVGTSSYNPIFNLNLSYELGEGRVQNASPDRFNTEDDLKEYMQGLMDVIYTLDYAEAQSTLSKTPEQKSLLFNQLRLTADPNKANVVNDTFEHISIDTAKKLTSIDSLIDNNIVAGRFKYQGTSTIGTANDNGYYVVPLFEPIYAAVQNDTGAVGDISFRRYAYELLAEYGYSNGMVSYISNEYANDKEALNAILDNKYNGSLAEFKKDMFARRISKLKYLKSTPYFNTFEDLQKAMDEAVEKDLIQMEQNNKNNINLASKVTAVNKLKTQIFQWYLTNTKDFKTSIYEDVVISEKKEVSESEVPVTIIEATDDTLWEDESYTVEGTAGIIRTTKVWKTENGNPVGDPEITTETIKEMKPTVIYRGTKKIVGEEVTVDTVKIPVKTVEVLDSNLYVGETKTVIGEEGIKKVTRTQKTEKGQPVGEAIITEEIIKTMKPTYIYIGTKPLPSNDDNVVDKPENDNVVDNPGNDNVVDNPGNDNVVDNPGNDNVVDNPGNDNVVDNPGNDNVVDNPGNDNVVDNPGNDNVVDNPGNDNIVNKPGNNNKVQNSIVLKEEEIDNITNIENSVEEVLEDTLVKNEELELSSNQDDSNTKEDATTLSMHNNTPEEKESSNIPLYAAAVALIISALAALGFTKIKK